MSTSGGTSGDGADLQLATVTIDTAEIATLFASPVEIVAAPGADRVLVMANLFLEYETGVTAFLAVGNGVGAFYGSVPPEGESAAGEVLGNGMFGPPAGHRVGVGGALAEATEATVAVNAPLVIGSETEELLLTGPVVTATIDDGGLGYVVGDTGTFVGTVGTAEATYVVTAVTPVTGIVTAFTVVTPGNGYTTDDNPLSTATGGAQPGVGADFTVNITAIPPADGTVYATVTYFVATTH